MNRGRLMVFVLMCILYGCDFGATKQIDVEWSEDVLFLSKYFENGNEEILIDSAKWFIYENCQDCLGKRSIIIALIHAKTDSFSLSSHVLPTNENIGLESKYLNVFFNVDSSGKPCFLQIDDYYQIREEYVIRELVMKYGFRGILINCRGEYYVYAVQD